MKKFLLFLLLLITGFSPTWADKLKLHVTDMQNHNVAHIKLNLNYPEAESQTTDANGYVTFDVPNGFFDEIGEQGMDIYLGYTCDELDVDPNRGNTYPYTAGVERHISQADKDNVIEVTFEHDTFLRFDFTQHLTKLQRNYLNGKSITMAVNYNDGETATRCFKYNGEDQKSLFFKSDKSSYKVMCYVNSEYFGESGVVIAQWPEGSVFLPATIGVDLTKDRTPITLNSVIGIDGHPVTQGRVGDYDLANGLPAVVRYVDKNDYNVRLSCLLNNYQGFTLTCPQNVANFDIDLQGKGRTIHTTLKDHNGNAMSGAKILTLKSIEQSYRYDSLLVTTSNEQGKVSFNAINEASNISPWKIVVVPPFEGYPPTEIDPRGDDTEGDTNIVIDYSHSRFINVRIKDFSSDAWKERFTNYVNYNVYYKNKDDGRYEAQYITFNEGNDLICRAIISADRNVDVHDLQLELQLQGYTSSEGEDVLPYTINLETLPKGDLNYTIAPLEWKKVNIAFTATDEPYLRCSKFTIDGSSFEYKEYFDGNYNNAVVMPAGEHALNMRLEGNAVLYDYGTPQMFTVKKEDNNPQATFALNRAAYAGYEVTVTAPNGTPAETYSLALNSEANYNSRTIFLNEEGKGRIYTAPSADVMTYTINTYDIDMKPYTWTAKAVTGPQQKVIDLSKEYNKIDLSIKTHDDSYNYVYATIYWSETADALNNVYDNNGNNDSSVYEMGVSNWENADGSNLFNKSIYLPKGWICGYANSNNTQCLMPVTQLSENMAYTFNFSTFSKVTFDYEASGYGGRLVVIRTSDNKQMEGYGQLYAPGQYKACYIGFEENGDYYYIQAPSTTFTIAGDGKDMTVKLTRAADDDYIYVPLSATGTDSDFGALTRANVSVVYDGLFNLTENNNNGEFSFNKAFTWKMLKGSYDYKVGYLWFEKGTVVAHNLNGHLDVKDNASVFNIDLSGVHQFSSTAITDMNGNSIDWEGHGLSVDSYTIIDHEGKAHHEVFYGTSYGLFIANGDYDVILTAYDKNYNAQSIKAQLHVDDQSGKVATFRTTEITGINESLTTDNALQAQLSNGKLMLMGNNDTPIHLNVYSLSGVCVMSTTAHANDVIDLSNLQRGTYVIRMCQGNDTKSLKIVQ